MATYPSWSAGQRVTAGLLTAAQPTVMYKTVTTPRVSTTTLADDPDLTVTLVPGTHIVEFVLTYGATTGLFKTAWNASSGITSVNRSVQGPGSVSTDPFADNIGMRSGVHGYTTAVVYGIRSNGTQLVAVERGIVFTSATATLTLQWAQNVSNAAATSLTVGSYMTVTRIA